MAKPSRSTLRSHAKQFSHGMGARDTLRLVPGYSRAPVNSKGIAVPQPKVGTPNLGLRLKMEINSNGVAAVQHRSQLRWS